MEGVGVDGRGINVEGRGVDWDALAWQGFNNGDFISMDSLDPRPSDLCIHMEGLVHNDSVG